eukprot:COSAG02_NODE_11437_length_1723_cov_13.163793_2_plen_161_part_00
MRGAWVTTEPPGASALLHAGAVATPVLASGCGAMRPDSYPLPRMRLRPERVLAPRSARAVDAVDAVVRGAVERTCGRPSPGAVTGPRGRSFEPESAEDLRRSAIFVKYTVICFSTETVQSISRDNIVKCRKIGGRDWVVTTDYQNSLISRRRTRKSPIFS